MMMMIDDVVDPISMDIYFTIVFEQVPYVTYGNTIVSVQPLSLFFLFTAREGVK
jgi:hypothetical protein